MLQKVRSHGYVAMPSQQIRGVTNIAFPIQGPSGEVIAAINVPYIERIDVQSCPDQDSVLKAVASVATRISGRLGRNE